MSQFDDSFLRPNRQLEGMSADINLATFHLQMRDKAGINLVQAIKQADIQRTIIGASTLTVVVEDDLARTIQNSGKLGRKVDVEVDGLFFTLVAVSKKGRALTLTFEERNVNVLRYYTEYIQVARAKSTRAQFVQRLLKEVTEVPLRYVIPELTVKETISDLQPGDILIDGTGKPLPGNMVPTDPITRQPGISVPAAGRLTVKGAPATAEQLQNANTVLQTGQALGARRKVLVCSIMTAITESRIINNPGGDRDSVGVFQQRASQGWPATRNVATDAAEYFKRTMALDAIDPTISYNDLCQRIQGSGFPNAYGQYQPEAEAIVNNYGVTGGDGVSSKAAAAANNQKPGAQTPVADVSTGYFFTRGSINTVKSGQRILTKENSWQCMNRLAQEVNWRCFCISSAIYFISDVYLFASKSYMLISEDSPGIDWIDYDFDEGKRVATLDITAHLGRWSAPPGSTLTVFGMGDIVDGKWLVQDVSRSVYESTATITCVKPQPVLPEPTTGSTGSGSSIGVPPMPSGVRSGIEAAPTPIQQKIIDYAQTQLGLPYAYGTEAPGISFDCSGLAQAAYGYAGISIPRVAQDQYNSGTPLRPPLALQAGDLVFFGSSVMAIHHVGIYIGNGQMINAPHTGAVIRVDSGFINWTDPPYIGAVRLWAT